MTSPRGASVLIVAILVAASCRDEAPRVDAAPSPLFVDEARETGLDFEHFAGITGRHWFAEIVGSGAALFDADGDGDLDAYLVQGNLLSPDERAEDALRPPPGPLPLSDRLFRNDLVETGTLHFTDVTEAAGIASTSYGMGVTVGDVDDDGDLDLYVTAFGANRLLENLGGLRFRDATERSGTAETRWSTSAVFADFDRDGHLDLFVGNYVDFSLARHKPCRAPSGAPDYCGPLAYEPLPNRYFHNRGDGTFEDAASPSGVLEQGGALGVLARDFDGDGWIDIYVANDGRPNQLWRNQGDGSFRNEALRAGCAYNDDGVAEASMGVDAADFDGDGDDDLFLTHLLSETNTLYLNEGNGVFRDVTFDAGLGVQSQAFTGFGTAWIDVDNDGWLDLLVVNGEVRVIEAQRSAGRVPPLAQRNQVFRNTGGGRFEEVSEQAGPALAELTVSRGAAFGDVDNDGDADVLVLNNSGPAQLLVNQVGQDSSWLGLDLREREGAGPAVGARAACELAGGRRLWRAVRPDGSYLSANDPRLLFGLAREGSIEAVRVRWADGSEERWSWDGRPSRTYVELVRGTGVSEARP